MCFTYYVDSGYGAFLASGYRAFLFLSVLVFFLFVYLFVCFTSFLLLLSQSNKLINFALAATAEQRSYRVWTTSPSCVWILSGATCVWRTLVSYLMQVNVCQVLHTVQCCHSATVDIIMIIIIIINLIYIAQFDTNGILTALYIVIMYIQMQYVHVWTYMKQSYKYTYTCLHISKYTITCTDIYLPTY